METKKLTTDEARAIITAAQVTLADGGFPAAAAHLSKALRALGGPAKRAKAATTPATPEEQQALLKHIGDQGGEVLFSTLTNRLPAWRALKAADLVEYRWLDRHTKGCAPATTRLTDAGRAALAPTTTEATPARRRSRRPTVAAEVACE